MYLREIMIRMDIQIKDCVTCTKRITKALGAFGTVQRICTLWLKNKPMEYLYVNASKRKRIRSILGLSRRAKKEWISAIMRR